MVSQGKPAPDPYLKATDFLKVSPESCLVIENASFGDNSEDYEIELDAKDEIITNLKAELATKQTVIETKPSFSEARLFKLEIADKMMKLAGLDNVSDIPLD